jgi:hypothetical protein
LPKLINETGDEVPITHLRYEFEYVWGLLNSVFFNLIGILPVVKGRRGISSQLALIAIVVIVAVGGVLIYFLVVSAPSTTTYP